MGVKEFAAKVKMAGRIRLLESPGLVSRRGDIVETGQDTGIVVGQSFVVVGGSCAR